MHFDSGLINDTLIQSQEVLLVYKAM